MSPLCRECKLQAKTNPDPDMVPPRLSEGVTCDRCETTNRLSDAGFLRIFAGYARGVPDDARREVERIADRLEKLEVDDA